MNKTKDKTDRKKSTIPRKVHTPWGIFDSINKAYMNKPDEIEINRNTFYHWFKISTQRVSKKIFVKSPYLQATPDSYGKTFKELGFFYISSSSD